MRLAIMQPYLLPYIGYFQLIAAVDRFVFLDDVNYINRGWINRNRILVGGNEHLFTLNLKDASQNKKINEIEIAADGRWTAKFFKTLEGSYRKAPRYSAVMPLLKHVFETSETNLAAFIVRSIGLLAEYLSIRTELVPSSSMFGGQDLKGQQRILHICEQTRASLYVNPPGGRDLYDEAVFRQHNVELRFLRPSIAQYKQFQNEFVASLSIIDVMMFNDPAVIAGWLDAAEVELP